MVQVTQDDQAGHPALKDFNSTWEYVKHVGTEALKTGLKGAVIGGLALAVLMTPVGAAAGILSTPVNWVLATFGMKTLALGTGAIMAGASQGLFLGGLAGAAIGLARGFSGAEEAVEDREQALITKYQRAQQLSANQQIMAMNMERLRAAQMGGMAMQPQMQAGLPMGQSAGQKGFGYTG